MSKSVERAKRRAKKEAASGFFTFIIILLIIVAIFVFALYLYTNNERTSVVYPTSPLSKMLNQSTAYVEDDSLPETVTCPTIPARLNVGGTERGMTDSGVVFRYNDDLSISIYEVDNGAYEVLSTNFAYDLYNGQLAGEPAYILDSDTIDVGYFNGYPSEYQCGKINVLDNSEQIYKELYVVSIVLDLGMSKDILISVSTNDKANLYDAEVLMEKIGYTVMDISQTADGKEESLSNGEVGQDLDAIEALNEESTLADLEPVSEAINSTTYNTTTVSYNKSYGDTYTVSITLSNPVSNTNDIIFGNSDRSVVLNPEVSDGVLVYTVVNEEGEDYYLDIPTYDNVGDIGIEVSPVEEDED